MNKLSKNLVYLLKRYDTTQVLLASYAGVSQNSISNWINEISYPNAVVLELIHNYFGISIDALLLTDIEKSGIITDRHVADFKSVSKVRKYTAGKTKPVSKEYFKGSDHTEQTVHEPDPGATGKVMAQLKQISEKIDQLKVSVDAIPGKKRG